ncbi:FISUMP domain-containing protein [uncultured Fibrobacter sp.]|uniref:FISUMP domain-containing protein n=1 Tax=uncultured Fibrobacter sp. TaxID=261512 RepID=UPI0028059210|nr:FISUMP domain-containing protein [uncultured Fibrobacter sp.]
MKRRTKYFSFLFIFSILLIALSTACSENSSSAGDSFDASVVCPAEGLNAYGEPNRGTFIDERDGQEYKYTTIGKQVWMAENLNVETENSYCADDACLKGRVYAQSSATSVCPTGWHLPTNDEWQTLFENMGGADTAGYRLKAMAGWLPLNPGELSNGTDDCAFGVLPIPITSIYTTHSYNPNKLDGYAALLWTADINDLSKTTIGIVFESQTIKATHINYDQYDFLSIRCVKD